jgi:hypothetical protein
LYAACIALDHLDQAHHRRGVEEVEPAHLVAAACRLAHLGDRQRRRVRGEYRVPGSDLVELGEHGLLDLHPLRDGLDNEVDVAEALVLGRALDAADDLAGLLVGLLLRDLLLLHEAGKLALSDLFGLLEPCVDELLVDVLQDDVDVRGGQHLGDLPAHRAGADHGGFEYEHVEFLRTVRGRRRGAGGPVYQGRKATRPPAPLPRWRSAAACA